MTSIQGLGLGYERMHSRLGTGPRSVDPGSGEALF